MIFRSCRRLQLCEELCGVRRVHKLVNPYHFAPISCECQEQGILVCVVPYFCVCCARGMQHACARLKIMYFLVNTNLSQLQSTCRIWRKEKNTVKFENRGITPFRYSR
jgi:hypothetical protein